MLLPKDGSFTKTKATVQKNMLNAVDKKKNNGKPAEPEQKKEAVNNQMSHHWKQRMQTEELEQQVWRQTAQFYLQLL